MLMTCMVLCGYSQTILQPDIKKLKWLSGNWVRTNNKQGQTGMESWTFHAEGLKGKGFTLAGKDTVFLEQLSIALRGKDLFYVVRAAAEAAPVYFRFTSITDSSFICENPQHDFPKKIAYRLQRGKMKATISGDGQHMDFLFRR